jgi:hypothetical protein
LLAAFALAGCGGDDRAAAPSTSTGARPDALVDVQNVLDIRAAFEEDRGKTRLVMLLSPT